MNYKFSNLLGSPYRGGNLLLVDSDLLSAGGNRVLQAGVLSYPIAASVPLRLGRSSLYSPCIADGLERVHWVCIAIREFGTAQKFVRQP